MPTADNSDLAAYADIVAFDPDTVGAGETTRVPGAASGLHVDRVVLASDERAAGTTGPAPASTVTSTGPPDRTVAVEDGPGGCWLGPGEGFNGWWIPPPDGPTEVRLHWTAQTPMNIALLVTLFAVLVCIAIAGLDHNRVPIPVSSRSDRRGRA